MSFFTTRERAELGKSAEIRMERKVRDVVRNEFAPRRRPDSDLPGHVGSVRQQRPADNDLEGHIGSVMQKVTQNSLQEIDDVIVALRRRREELLSESVQSARIMTESLSQLNRIPAPPHKSESECHVGDVSNEQHRVSGSSALVQPNMRGQAGETAVPASSDVSALPEEASGRNPDLP